MTQLMVPKTLASYELLRKCKDIFSFEQSVSCHGFQPWSEVLKLFSCSAELSLKKVL